jgi:catechol 2,3-dioxygenase-like lactoylglutathione lyase family enzyme
MQTPISGITFLKTKDLQATTDFYTKVLGFTLALDQGKCRIFEVCSNCYVGFCLTDESTGSDEVILTFEVEDVDGYCNDLEGKGLEIEVHPRFNSYYNIYQMFLRDPNGYLLEIQRFLDPWWRSNKSLENSKLD